MRVFSGKYRGRKLYCPKSGVRPTSGRVREALFNIFDVEGMRVLDIFAGTGAIGIEALSRGASQVTFIEQDPSVLEKNLNALDLEAEILSGDFELALQRLEGRKYDLIFADPPYRQGLGERLLILLDQRPLLAPEGELVIEEVKLEVESLKQLKLSKVRSYGKTFIYQYLLI